MRELDKQTQQLYHNNLIGLSKAIQKAGGAVSTLSTDLTLGELLKMCAMNGISLYAKFEPPEKKPTRVQGL